MIKTRFAADAVGGTKMDRPEDIETNPVNGKVYCPMTNNSRRGTADNPGKPVEVTAKQRAHLKDLSEFVGIFPSSWLQLRISGRGLKCNEWMIEDTIGASGYRREEWVDVEGSETRLGIFGTKGKIPSKMVFCLESKRQRLRCDLLLPVIGRPTLATGAPAESIPSQASS